MAVTSGGAVASSDGGGGAASVNVSPPSGLASGDLWVIVVVADIDPGGVINTPSGFTAAHDQFGATGIDLGIRTFWKIAGSSESQVAVSMDDNAYIIWCDSIRITGPFEGDPIGNVNNVAPEGSDSTIDAPDVTIQNNGSVALLIYGGTNTTGITQPSGTTLLQSQFGATTWPSAATAYQEVNAGSYTPGNWTLVTGATRAAVTLEILPPGEGSPAPDAPSISATATSWDAIQLDVTVGANTDEVNVYRSTSSPVDPDVDTLVGTVTESGTIFDDELDPDTTYYHLAVASNTDGDTEGTEQETTTWDNDALSTYTSNDPIVFPLEVESGKRLVDVKLRLGKLMRAATALGRTVDFAVAIEDAEETELGADTFEDVSATDDGTEYTVTLDTPASGPQELTVIITPAIQSAE